MKLLQVILLFAICIPGEAQKNLITTDPSLAIPPISFDANGELIITASPTSSQHDFDFLVGKWKMYHRRLNKRLENCKDWTEFQSQDENHKILNGIGDVDTYYTTELPGMEGVPFEGFTLRLFNPKTRLWSLYWVPSTTGVLDPPVAGSFENGVGHFFTKDTFNGKNIIVVFRWDVRDTNRRFGARHFHPTMAKPGNGIGTIVSERVK